MSSQTIFLCITVVLVGLSGLFSGLNLGLMSFTDDDLRVVIEGSSDPKEVANAKRIRPLRKRGNLLLCTLLLGNTLVNAMIAILLADIASGLVGGLVTTALIVVFGEITPQSVCSRYALAIGAKSVPIVWVFLLLCLPIAYPISVILDYVLGREMGGIYSRGELLALIAMNSADPERAKETGLTADDGKILSGALTYSTKQVEEIMTPLERVFSLSIDRIINKDTVVELLQKGHTRVPIFDGAKSNIVAVMYCRDLMGIGWERNLPVKTVISINKCASRLCHVPKTMKANDAFAICKKEHRHMLVVTDGQPASSSPDMPITAVGVITLEDIIEEIIQDKIIGEQDEFAATVSGKKYKNPKRVEPLALLKTLEALDADGARQLPGAVNDKG